MLSIRSLPTADDIKAASEITQRCASDEQDRLASAEERLRGLVSLAAVAAAVTVGIGVAQLRGELQVTLLGTLFALAVVYAVVQLLSTLLAAIKGLERRSFRVFRPEDLIPKHGEAPKDREIRLFEISFDAMIDVQDAANQKVEQMSIAYRALKSFVLGVLFASTIVFLAQIDGCTDGRRAGPKALRTEQLPETSFLSLDLVRDFS